MSTPSFEIRGVSYTSNMIKKGRSYRFCIEWSPPDVDGASKFTTRTVHASADGTLELLPFSMKRFFNSLPPRISLDLHQRQLKLIWKTLDRHHVSLAVDRKISEHIDGALGLHLTISPHAPGAEQVEGAANTAPSTNNQLSLNAHKSPELSTTKDDANTISEPAAPSKISPPISPVQSLPSTAEQATTGGMPAQSDVNVSGGSAAINADNSEEAAAKTAKAEEALGVPKSNKLLDAGSSVTDQYNHAQPLKDDFLAAFPYTITAVEGLLKLGGLIAEVHPVAKVIVGILKGAYTVIQANAQVNAHMHTLLSSMKALCILTKQYATSKEQDSAVRDIVQDISFTVMTGATLINGYAEHQKHKCVHP
ncbi:hypothetical protein DL93DRAFT_1752096 [Clavulina sp. PMI_390]|nr:hypothetical protein DL93DRAFT_1752096 [Clavulina sp. PMI_390]